MPTVQKQEKIETFIENLKTAKIIFVAEYQGLTVADVSSLRRELFNNGAEMKVMKNSLAKRALKEVGYEALSEKLTGPLAFFLGYENVVTSPKIAFAFAKDHEILKIKAGYYEGKVIDEHYLKALASLPPMVELRAIFYRVLSSPTKQFFTMIKAPLKQLVVTLEGLEKKLSGTEEESN